MQRGSLCSQASCNRKRRSPRESHSRKRAQTAASLCHTATSRPSQSLCRAGSFVQLQINSRFTPITRLLVTPTWWVKSILTAPGTSFGAVIARPHLLWVPKLSFCENEPPTTWWETVQSCFTVRGASVGKWWCLVRARPPCPEKRMSSRASTRPASDLPVQQEGYPATKHSYRVYSFAHAAEDLPDVVLLRFSEFLDWNCSWAQAKQPCLQQVMTKAVGVCIEPTSLRSNVTLPC